MTTITLTELIMQLAARPTGFRAEDVVPHGFTLRAAGTRALQLNKTGKLHRLQVSRRNTRFFVRSEHLHAFSTAARGLVQPKAISTQRDWNAAEAITPPHVKVQYGPAFVPRFTTVDLPGVVGALQRGRA